MDLEQLANKIDSKFEKLEEKLDVYAERVTRIEEKYNSISGQVKLMFALIGAIGSGIISYIVNKFST